MKQTELERIEALLAPIETVAKAANAAGPWLVIGVNDDLGRQMLRACPEANAQDGAMLLNAHPRFTVESFTSLDVMAAELRAMAERFDATEAERLAMKAERDRATARVLAWETATGETSPRIVGERLSACALSVAPERIEYDMRRLLDVQHRAQVGRILDDAAAVEKERDELRERLAKLEAAGARLFESWDSTDSLSAAEEHINELRGLLNDTKGANNGSADKH